jgi:hypothetical protein
MWNEAKHKLYHFKDESRSKTIKAIKEGIIKKTPCIKGCL